MEFVIGAILLIFTLSIIGYIIRKKYIKELNQIELRKVETMNRPVINELSKVKQLNITGQTEEKFEYWRLIWDDIVTEELPKIDDLLFDCEEYLDRFRFKKAKSVQIEMNHRLLEINKKIDQLLTEINELVGTEEQNRMENEELMEIYRIARKQLLAHRHTFGKAAAKIESKLDAFSSLFEQFEELRDQGNYIDAREVILKIHNDLHELVHKMDRIPILLSESQSILPSQLNEIEDGYKEMEQEGYLLDHLQIEKQITLLRKEIDRYQSLIELTEIEEVENSMVEVKENIDLLYDLLENEVESKHFIFKNSNATLEKIQSMKKENEQLREETEFVQQGYHLLENELDVPKRLEKEIAQMEKRYELLAQKIFDQRSAYSLLNIELKEIRQILEQLQKDQQSFTEFLQTLRKDEMEAREKMTLLKKKIIEASRLVTKSNVPGLPDYYISLMENAKGNIEEVNRCLNEKPLTMKSVQEHLEIAVDSVDNLYEKTIELIEQVLMAEKIIQYGNRYRSTNSYVSDRLNEAEAYFRNYEFRQALEQAATAIEKVDSKGLKKIEEMINDEITIKES
ncbi:septation ring formation regulator [Oikeobacillus pervagus]|uniref:Septation ring formation regulator EzrA n=1 Tax=Oikeobacillus pervagus TaxID=1325931 RepID=A0AAJ1T1C3_9BACI|nr:septation ring formation regulator EzrA [Oikeobacillus pervagus]MDQ0215017.1 septation ring formation regulator [Oikeobacillus pervagus]